MKAYIFQHPVNQLTKKYLVTKVTESVASSGKLYELPPNKEKTVNGVIQDCHYKSRGQGFSYYEREPQLLL